MQFIRWHAHSGPEVLVYEDVPEPVSGPGQVLILFPQNQSLTGSYLGGWFAHRPREAGAALQELAGLVAAGEVLPLSQVAEAHRRPEGRLTAGKIVLQPRTDA